MSNIVKFDIKQAPHAFDEVLELQIGSWAVPAGEITVEQYLKDCVAAVSDLKIADVNDKEGYEIVSRARKDLAKLRTTLEKTGKAARDNANAFAKAVIAEEKRLISIPSALEEEYKKMEKAYDDHWAEEEGASLKPPKNHQNSNFSFKSWSAIHRTFITTLTSSKANSWHWRTSWQQR
ncbi:MAG TPA: hypothetical protein DCG24_02860 [Bacteroidetes bacterium]|nr:hypothetical protein [Bacteroidota bacterium]